MPKKADRRNQGQIVGLLGVGLDNNDGQTRITRNEEVLLVGGSKETHELMQEVSIRFNEKLKARGKTLRQAEIKEVIDLLREAHED